MISIQLVGISIISHPRTDVIVAQNVEVSKSEASFWLANSGTGLLNVPEST